MSNVIIDIVTQFSGKKAFKDADNAAARLSSTVKKLGAAFGVSLGGAAVARFAKSSAKAFIEDEKAASRLTQSVKNLGLAYAADDIRKYVDQLTLATGVADNDLRPALQALLQVTGSVTKSQQLLSDAISISRGSGENLTTVANDLSQAYVGNLKGLRKYNLGLTQAELKASSFADIQQRLNSLFSGASAAYLKTYAGQMEVLANTASEAKEIIGKDLVNALILVSGQTGVENLSTQMMDLATFTGDAVYGLGVLIEKLNNLGGLKQIGGLMGLLELNPITGIPIGIASALAQIGKSAKAAKNTFNFASGGGLGTGSTKKITDAQAAAAEKAAKKRADALLKLQLASNKAAADALKVKKAGGLLDIEQAGIIAALKGQISKEDETRLKLQFAILTGNTTEASKLAGELAKAQGLTQDLVDFYMGLPDAKNPFSGWITTLNDARQLASDIAKYQTPNISIVPPTGGTTGTGISTTSTAGNLFQSIVDQGLAQGQSQATINSTLRYTAMGQAAMNSGVAPEVNVTILLDGAEIAPAVTKVQTNGYLSGKIIALERTLGSFG
jgi:hypothetical protein